MSRIIVPSRRIWTRQPPLFGGIDWTNPHTNGLTGVWVGPLGPKNLVGKDSKFLPIGTKASPRGIGGLYVGELSTESAILSSSWSFLVGFVNGTIGGLGSFESVVGRGPTSGSNNIGFGFNASHSSIPYSGAVFQGSGYSIIGKPTGGTLEDNKFYVIGAGSTGGVGSVYNEGRLITGASGLSAVDTTGRLTFGMDSTGTSAYGSGKYPGLVFLFVWNRDIGADAFLDLSSSPYQLFAPANSPVFYSLSAGVTNYSMTADTGSFTLTGNAATLAAQRKITADTGAFTLTGNAAGLTVQRKLTADTGAFTLTGNDATLTYSGAGSKEMTAETGAFTLTGNAAGLAAQRQLAAATGAFTLTGNDVTLAYARGIGAGTGAFTLTGIDVTLSTTGTVTASAQPTGAGRSKKRRRRIELDGRLYEVDERDVPALLEAVIRDSKPPGTAEVVEAAPKAPKSPKRAAAEPVQRMPEPVSVEMVVERFAALQQELARQAEQDVLRMLDRVAQRVLAEVEDEDEALTALLLA